jgi:hypothetical protein
MAYQIDVDAGRACLVITHHGEISVAEARAAQSAALAAVAQHGLERVLIDVTGITNELSVLDLFMVTSDLDLPELPRPRGALLARADQAANAEFVETVALNRRLDIRSFADRDQALAWLYRD